MLPNFLVIGAPRCGTTTLYECLKQHPQIFMSPLKEPMFFILEDDHQKYVGPAHPTVSRNIDGYQSLFQNVRGESAIGEASPCYLFSERAPGKIKKYVPNVKIIIMLRNPVDRSYSHFLFNRLGGIEPLASFEAALAAEEDRIRKGWFIYWHYISMGYYGQQIERYFSYFDRTQFRFFLLEDLIREPAKLFREVFQFLGVEDTVRIEKPEKYNSSGEPRSRIVHDLISKPSILKTPLKKILSTRTQYRLLTIFINRNLEKPPLSRAMRSRMIELYRKDILKTQELIHRDLSPWFEL